MGHFDTPWKPFSEESQGQGFTYNKQLYISFQYINYKKIQSSAKKKTLPEK